MRRKSIVALSIVCMLVCAEGSSWAKIPGNEKNPDAVAKVQSGSLKTANAAWWGFDENDATVALQSAVDSGAKTVIVPNMGKDWIVRPINLAGGQEVIFEKGAVVTAKKGEYKGGNDCLFGASEKSGIVLRGYGAVLRMQKDDYMTPAYSKGEWRMVLRLNSCTNVKILGLTLKDSGGDGIYLGVAGNKQLYNKNILIKDVICENNYRQGISVISASDLLIENCIFRTTWGTAPEAGIDLEPNKPEEKLENCIIKNCRFENNRGAGIAFWLGPLNAGSSPISVTFENCRVTSDRGDGIFIGGIQDNGPEGTIRFKNCIVEDVDGYGLLLSGKSSDRAYVSFNGCVFRRTARHDLFTKPISIAVRSNAAVKRQGGVEFNNCRVEDDKDRPFFSVSDNGSGTGLHMVNGSMKVANPYGARTELGPNTEKVDIRVKTK